MESNSELNLDQHIFKCGYKDCDFEAASEQYSVVVDLRDIHLRSKHGHERVDVRKTFITSFNPMSIRLELRKLLEKHQTYEGVGGMTECFCSEFVEWMKTVYKSGTAGEIDYYAWHIANVVTDEFILPKKLPIPRKEE